MNSDSETGILAESEQREPAPPVPVYLDARGAFAGHYLAGEGLEVGPLHQPLALPPGARARYVDRMSVDDLRREYPELAEWNLTEVDVIDDGERLATIADESQDFIVANHFLEHCENPIRTIETHLGKLKPGGVLFYAVPDKRFTFDFRRQPTPLQHMVDDYEQGPEAGRARHYDEWVRLVVREEGETDEQCEARARELESAAYSIHMHVWTQAEFLRLILACRERLGDGFDVQAAASVGIEFIVVLRKAGPYPAPTVGGAPGSGPPPPVVEPSELQRWKGRARRIAALLREDYRRWRNRP